MRKTTTPKLSRARNRGHKTPFKLLIIASIGLLFTQLLCSFFVNDESNAWMCEESKFTYQIIMNGRGYPNLPITLCDEIESKRKQSSRVIIKYSDYVSIEVFSKDEIQTIDKTIKEVRYE